MPSRAYAPLDRVGGRRITEVVRGVAGFLSDVQVFPEAGAAFVILINADWGFPQDTVEWATDTLGEHEPVYEWGELATEDVVGSYRDDIVLGGIHNWLEVSANNHRTVCNINPNNAMKTYNPVDANFDDIYVVEKTGTKEGWSNPSPDEDWFTGYPQEIDAFYRTVAYGDAVESDSRLAADCISTSYSAYVSADNGGAEEPIRTF